MHHAYHTQSIAFRYLLPYCARTGYATEGALFSGVKNSGTVWKKVPESDARSVISRVHVFLAVTCHLHFWQNDRDLLRATAVRLGWNGY